MPEYRDDWFDEAADGPPVETEWVEPARRDGCGIAILVVMALVVALNLAMGRGLYFSLESAGLWLLLLGVPYLLVRAHRRRRAGAAALREDETPPDGRDEPPPRPRSRDILHLDHVQLAMPPGGEDAARRFFVDVFGLTEEEKPTALRERGGCWFRGRRCVVHVGVDPDFRPQRKAHPAFVVDDLDDLARRLEEAGHPVRWDDALEGVDRFYTDDPFGNRIELIGAGQGFAAR